MNNHAHFQFAVLGFYYLEQIVVALMFKDDFAFGILVDFNSFVRLHQEAVLRVVFYELTRIIV